MDRNATSRPRLQREAFVAACSVALCVSAFGWGGCDKHEAPVSHPPAIAPTSASELGAEPLHVEQTAKTSATPEPGKSTTRASVLLVTDPQLLSRWAEALDFGDLLFGLPKSSSRQLLRSSEYERFLHDLEHAGLGRSHRRWLRHPRVYWTLVGVVNRLDRRDMRPGTCGETRLIYRLEYRGSGEQRRLPAALNLVFKQPDDGLGCKSVAQSWFVADQSDPNELTEAAGPLHSSKLVRSRLLAVETNLRHDQVRQYDPVSRRFIPVEQPGNTMAVFEAAFEEGIGLHSVKLEFEPTGALVYNTPSQRRGAWKEVVNIFTKPNVLEQIVTGTIVLRDRAPGKWWSTEFIDEGTAPAGAPFFEQIWRLAGKPSIEPQVAREIVPFGTPQALAHRVDTLSCSGCHRRRAIAGFHLPGAGADGGLMGGASPHLVSELNWRSQYVLAVAAGEEPNRRRKLANASPARLGQHCSLPHSPVSDLTCASGFTCGKVSGFAFGQCFPASYAGPGPCSDGATMSECLAPSAWFPGGFMAKSCTEGSPCAKVVRKEDYAACRREQDPWSCAWSRAVPMQVDACKDQLDCRDGYACTRMPGETVAVTGVCLPVAAMSEFRSSGHERVVR
jgi:hypothetical protein